MKGRIIAAFPCSGKTHAVTKYYNMLNCIDHDFYDWRYRSTYKEDEWLDHYMIRMQQLRKKFEYVFVNALPEIILKLPKDSIIIYPNRNMKAEWLTRAKSRGGVSKFPQLLEEKWNEWVDACKNWPGKSYVLYKEEYLSDIIKCSFGITVNVPMPGGTAPLMKIGDSK